MSLKYYRDGMVGHGVAKIDGGEKIQRALLRKQKNKTREKGGKRRRERRRETHGFGWSPWQLEFRQIKRGEREGENRWPG